MVICWLSWDPSFACAAARDVMAGPILHTEGSFGSCDHKQGLNILTTIRETTPTLVFLREGINWTSLPCANPPLL